MPGVIGRHVLSAMLSVVPCSAVLGAVLQAMLLVVLCCAATTSTTTTTHGNGRAIPK